MTTSTTRRNFMKQMAAAGAVASTASLAIPRRVYAQNQKLRVAFIGVGGIGGQHRNAIHSLGEDCPCFADVDRRTWGEILKQWPNARGYQDYREMFDKEAKNFDAVMIGTPDHHHYPATVLAFQAGKHVYTQKPLTQTVWEARQLTKLAAANPKIVTQMGNQGHAGEGWRLVYEWIHSGALGDVLEVHSWTNRPVWPQGIKRPEGEDPVPSELDWDVWIGPSPMRPYKNRTYHGFNWRGWWDFGAGALGDMACHTMDGMFWALDPGHAATVEPVAATPHNDDSFPSSTVVKWTFPAKGNRKAFTAYWYDGGLKPPRPADLEPNRRLAETGNLFIGTKASIIVSGDYGDSPRIYPESKMREIGRPPRLLERHQGGNFVANHIKEWVNACKGQGKTLSDFAYAGPMSETILLGNVAIRVGTKLEWDGENMRVTNYDAANEFITKPYRDGWKF